MTRGNTLAQNRHNSLPYTVKTFRQRSCNIRAIDLLRGWVLNNAQGERCGGQDGYQRAQVPHHPKKT